MVNVKDLKISSGWDVNFVKKNPYMMFGSLMNVYGHNNEGQHKSVEDILKDAEKIWQFCLEKTFELQTMIHDKENETVYNAHAPAEIERF